MVLILIEETINGEKVLETVKGEISQQTTTQSSLLATFRSKDIKITEQNWILEIQEDILKLLSLHKKFAIFVAIQTIHPELVELREKVPQEIDKNRSNRN